MNRTFLSMALAVLGALALSPSAYGQDYKLGELTIQHPWAWASAGAAKTGAAYMEIVNDGTVPDLLVAVASPVAEQVQLHAYVVDGGVAKMRSIEAIEVSPGDPVILQPGGLHVMLTGLKATIVAGQSFPLTLTFERAGSVTVEVIIQAPAVGSGQKSP